MQAIAPQYPSSDLCSRKGHLLPQGEKDLRHESKPMTATAITRRLLVALSLALAASACAGPPSIPAAPDAPAFTMERFFAGRTVGKGSFTSQIAGVNRGLTVVTRGRWDGKTLTLREDFAFDDGEKDVKTWRFTKVAPGVYEGTREDVIGKADIRQVGNTVQLRYTADVRARDGSVTRLDFADTIAPRDGRSVLNEAVVSKFGVPVGRVSLVFVR
jgi:Protein of unknown function (DUF3833)